MSIGRSLLRRKDEQMSRPSYDITTPGRKTIQKEQSTKRRRRGKREILHELMDWKGRRS